MSNAAFVVVPVQICADFLAIATCAVIAQQLGSRRSHGGTALCCGQFSLADSASFVRSSYVGCVDLSHRFPPRSSS